jgi:outer membrane immunogenic protein
MRKLFLTTTALVALMAGEGFGADLRAPVYKAPIDMAPSWAGLYIGGQVGGASVSTSFKDVDDRFGGLDGDRKLTWTAGVYGGINFQHDSFVYGIEAAWSWLDGTVTSFPFSQTESMFVRNKLRDYGSVKARAGLALGNTLVYVAAGPAWGGSHFSMARPDSSGASTHNDESASGNSHRLGLAAATGVERMLSPNWVLRGQVEYAQFQTQRITSSAPLDGTANRFGQESSVLTGTLGLSYKFGGL